MTLSRAITQLIQNILDPFHRADIWYFHPIDIIAHAFLILVSPVAAKRVPHAAQRIEIAPETDPGSPRKLAHHLTYHAPPGLLQRF